MAATCSREVTGTWAHSQKSSTTKMMCQEKIRRGWALQRAGTCHAHGRPRFRSGTTTVPKPISSEPGEQSQDSASTPPGVAQKNAENHRKKKQTVTNKNHEESPIPTATPRGVGQRAWNVTQN